MFRPLHTALAAVFSLGTLAGCNHFHRDAAPAFAPVAETPPPTPEPTYRGKYR